MGIEYFLFALMLFGMFLIVLFLFFHRKRRCQKAEESEWEERKQRLMTLYFEVQDMMETFETDVKNIRDWLELQREQMEARTGEQAAAQLPKTEQTGPELPREEPKQAKPLVHKILELQKSGMTEEEIAEKLSLSRNEIKFVLKINSCEK